jgi:hypothetical protein
MKSKSAPGLLPVHPDMAVDELALERSLSAACIGNGELLMGWRCVDPMAALPKVLRVPIDDR